MVSIKRNLGLFFIRSLVFVSFMGLCCAAYAINCSSSQAPCCKGKKMSCCPHPGYKDGKELSYDLSECMEVAPINPGGPIVIPPIVKECTSGQVQYKASGSCGTSERTCCSDGTWSDWDGECGGSSSCGTNQCWNGSKCEAKGETSTSCVGRVQETTGGTLTRTATCYSGSGWSYGSWKGTCTCPSGSTWTGSGTSGYCKSNHNGYWVCDHGSIISWDGCPTNNPLRGYSCSNIGATGTAYEDIGGGQCEMASCTCE